MRTTTRKRLILSLSVTLLFCCNLYSQENLYYEKSFSAFTKYFHENYGISCKELENTSNLNIYNECWLPRNDTKRSTAALFGPILQSNDKDCLFAYPAINMDYGPIGQISAEIESGLGIYYSLSHRNNADKYDFYAYATVIIGKKAREMFNADTLYIYDIPNTDSSSFLFGADAQKMEKIRKESYPYCTGLVICKAGRVATAMKLFLTEKGKIKEDEYINMLSNQIWYTDTFDSLEK